MNEREVRDAFATSTEWKKKHTAPVTGQVVASAPVDTDKRHVIDFLWINGDEAGTLQILDSDDNAIDGYFFTFGANGGVCIEGAFLEGIPLGKGFKYTVTGGGDYSVIIKHHEDVAR